MADRHPSMQEITYAGGAIVTGFVVALIAQILFSLLGIGFGFSVVGPESTAFNWSAFAWWAIAGIISAALGGYAVGMLKAGTNPFFVGTAAFVSWGLAVLVITFAAMAAGIAGGAAGLAGILAGPTYGLLDEAPTTAAARQVLMYASFGSFAALILGAFASVMAATFAAEGSRVHFRRTAGSRA